MSGILQAARRVVPGPVKDLVRPVYYWGQQAHWLLHPEGRASRSFTRGYKDVHRGERCFIIGNGPSLGTMDLSPLENEYTFGLNRIYLLFPRMGFHTTYFVSVNRLVIEQCAEDIAQLPMPRFISWCGRDAIHRTAGMAFINTVRDSVVGFSEDAARRVWEGATVTHVALQLAYYMGFTKAILIGVDHSFATKGTPHATVVSAGNDPNHFDPHYFGSGFRWQLPDLDTSELAYAAARERFAAAGRAVVDATVGGKLQVFPKVDYESLFH